MYSIRIEVNPIIKKRQADFQDRINKQIEKKIHVMEPLQST